MHLLCAFVRACVGVPAICVCMGAGAPLHAWHSHMRATAPCAVCFCPPPPLRLTDCLDGHHAALPQALVHLAIGALALGTMSRGARGRSAVRVASLAAGRRASGARPPGARAKRRLRKAARAHQQLAAGDGVGFAGADVGLCQLAPHGLDAVWGGGGGGGVCGERERREMGGPFRPPAALGPHASAIRHATAAASPRHNAAKHACGVPAKAPNAAPAGAPPPPLAR